MGCGDYFGNRDTVVVYVTDKAGRSSMWKPHRTNGWSRKWPVGCGKRCMCVAGKKVRQLSQKWKENQPCKETRAEMGEAQKVVKLKGY